MERATNLRKHLTDAEARLWSHLRAQQLGVKFRRQHPIDGYIVDFACIEKQLIVELDGGQHLEQQTYDERRTAALEALGFQVIRFWNHDALQRTDDVLESIIRALTDRPPPHPNPLPPLRRGRGSKATRPAAAAESPLLQAESGGEGWVRGRGHAEATQGGVAVKPETATTSAFFAFQLRAELYAVIRQFFAAREVLEVETPILSAAGNTEPNIESFSTRFSGHIDAGAPERFLRTSPEYPLKRLLAAGVGDCYELGRVFRNGEAGGQHNPEFTMLEWYRVGWDHRRLMTEVIELLQAAQALVGQAGEVAVVSYRDLFGEGLGVDPFTADEDALRAPLGDFGINPDGLTRDDWLDLLITHLLQADFPRGRITVIHGYPVSQCMLARIRNGDPPIAERFEMFLGPHELANGYHELNDAAEQRARFERDNRVRRQRGQSELPVDENLLAVLDGLPDCAGVALGIERLLMCLLGTDAIADVLAFPFGRA